MRRLRPEYYSDSVDRTTYLLDAPTLEYHLETITARNQTQAFEIFCRKLCERTICPNLKPATGPEGGGDSKADTETIPIADEIATLAYVGEANSGRERWAFAFSAKKKWVEKVRSDVAGIVGTGREYQKIFCVTARFARAKDRARVEDELTRQYGVTVTILDRTWIVEQVIEGDRKDLAFNYLGIGQEVAETRRLGPSDYSRAQQLDDVEKALGDPQAFAGMEMQRVTEALVAARLSRNLERPRPETDGRFARAVRLADEDGTYRQRLEARYEWIWTAFWWFDDIAQLNNSYDAFETLALETDHARNLEFLCNLAQLLFNAVIHGHLTSDEAKLSERVARLIHRLEVMAADVERPNNALEARTSLLVIQANQALIAGDRAALNALWPQFSDVLRRARGLGEFAAERLIGMIEVFGNVTGDDPGYARLIDDVAQFVSERTSEAQGALVLLKRAEQLDFDDCFEMIRLLGRAAHQLTKKEYASSFIEAMRLLSLAYRSAGLLWAARASCIFALASIFIEAEEDSHLPATVVPTLMLLAWIAIELRHLPDALEAIRLVRGCVAALPLDEASKEHAAKRLQEFDGVLGSQVLNFSLLELKQADRLPDVLDRLGLHLARTSLLYALGYEPLLREDGSIPVEETPEKVAELFTLLASQPASDNLRSPVIFNEPGQQIYVSSVLGIRIEVHHQGSIAAILAAEAVIGSIEALFATTIDLDAQPHAEMFTVRIEENTATKEPDFTLDEERLTATVRWPAGRLPSSYGQQGEVHRMLAALSASIFAATCFVQDMKDALKRFHEDDAVLDRIAMVIVVGNSRQRFLGKTISRLNDWTSLVETTFPPQASRPNIVRRKLESSKNEAEERHTPAGELMTLALPKDHRDLRVRSIIDVHLWNRAGWTGTAFADWGPSYSPAIALLFTDADAARKIFERWRERFGKEDRQEDIYVAIVRGISAEKPAHYRVLITSRLPPKVELIGGQPFMIAARINTMHAESDVNLVRFLGRYNELGAYWLVPAIWKGKGEPDFLFDLAILKRELSVKVASEVGENDIEAMALGPTR
ncbi:hypothetical protein SVA_3304 [Sulfurifustis variabilis]|uniref:Uncharacterized protein n=2 Tax=Sulfurifustis variabilis TaxID=1675686 RepID=A0A1C7AF40_9GAMM|nr:hypothetical protein SVA_3304 [Sulfurifustis variabilis]